MKYSQNNDQASLLIGEEADRLKLAKRASALLESFVRESRQVFNRQAVMNLAHLFGNSEYWYAYNRPKEVLCARWFDVAGCENDFILQNFNKALLCAAIIQKVPGVIAGQFPLETTHQILRNVDRIIHKLTDPSEVGDYSARSDIFLKDIGICTLRLLPAEYGVLDTSHALPRSLVYSGGLAQASSFVLFYWGYCGGRGPFFANHFHPELRANFSPEHRYRAFRQIADLMVQRPEIKALIGDAWYYDPVVSDISPHLAYVREFPEKNGAKIYRFRVDTSNSAFVNSEKRRWLFEKGEYQPIRYVMVWPREKLITWAATEVQHKTNR